METQRASEIKRLVLAGNTYEETAEILDISVSTVSLHMNAALRHRNQKYTKAYQKSLLKLKKRYSEEFRRLLTGELKRS